MSSPDTEQHPTPDDEECEPGVAVTSHQSSPDTVVFTEEHNTDAWIATDLTVDVTR